VGTPLAQGLRRSCGGRRHSATPTTTLASAARSTSSDAVSVVEKVEAREKIVRLEEQLAVVRQVSKESGVNVEQRLKRLKEQARRMREASFTASDRLWLARHPSRPAFPTAIASCTDGGECERLELNSDEIEAARATIGGVECIIIGHAHKRDREAVTARLGRAWRGIAGAGEETEAAVCPLTSLAEHQLPIVAFVDRASVSQNQPGEVLAEWLSAAFTAGVPLVAVVTGELGACGPLAGLPYDRVVMLGHAVAFPTCASAAAALLARGSNAATFCTASDAVDFNLADEVIPEEGWLSDDDYEATCKRMSESITRHLTELGDIPPAELFAQRLRRHGVHQ